MLVKDLNEMEKIVSANKNLYWDGWTVINFFTSDSARTNKNGAIINGKWCITKRIEPTRDGWNISDRLLK